MLRSRSRKILERSESNIKPPTSQPCLQSLYDASYTRTQQSVWRQMPSAQMYPQPGVYTESWQLVWLGQLTMAAPGRDELESEIEFWQSTQE